MSKLDYLSKYSSEKNDTDIGKNESRTSKNSKAKKRNKKLKSKHKKTRVETLTTIYDEDDICLNGDDVSCGYEFEEESPVVVNSLEIPVTNATAISSIHESNLTNGDQSGSDIISRNRKKYDSDDEINDNNRSDNENESGRPRGNRRRRYDSDDDDIMSLRNRSKNTDNVNRSGNYEGYKKRSKREHENESDTDESKQKTLIDGDTDEVSNSGDNEKSKKKELMSSGHIAGLQNTAQFNKAESHIKEKRRQELRNQKASTQETVYRDKHGKRLDTSQENLDSARYDKRSKKKLLQELTKKEEKELRTGKIQKMEQEELLRNFAEVQSSTFARSVNDTSLEEYQKNQVREGDPMEMQTDLEQQKNPGSVVKKAYKGPQPKPNRFNILPGYRWDGNDRGNGFEDLVLSKMYSVGRKKEEAYKWSCADM